MAENYSTGTTPQITNPTRVIEVKILQALNNGGGGGGTTQVFSGNYAGGTPSVTPTTAAAIGIDTSNGRQWQWFSGAWH